MSARSSLIGVCVPSSNVSPTGSARLTPCSLGAAAGPEVAVVAPDGALVAAGRVLEVVLPAEAAGRVDGVVPWGRSVEIVLPGAELVDVAGAGARPVVGAEV